MSTYIETVAAKDGKLEDKVVFGSAILILICATCLLYLLYPPQESQFEAIPKPIRASLTALSNAGEELMVLQELEGSLPSLNTLQELAIGPFSASQLSHSLEFNWSHDANCYVGQTFTDSGLLQIRLELPIPLSGQAPEVYWRQLSRDTKHSTSSNAPLSKACQSSVVDWHSAATLIQDHKHPQKGSHEH